MSYKGWVGEILQLFICQGHWTFSMGICKSGDGRRSVGTRPGATQQQGVRLGFSTSCVSHGMSCLTWQMSWCSDKSCSPSKYFCGARVAPGPSGHLSHYRLQGCGVSSLAAAHVLMVDLGAGQCAEAEAGGCGSR